MPKRMNRQQAEECFFSTLDVNASNVETLERILCLPYVVFCVVADSLCSGELTLEDFDGRIFELERRSSHLAEVEDVDVEALVRDALALSAGDDPESAAAAAVAGALSDLPAPGLVVIPREQSILLENMAILGGIELDAMDGLRPSGRVDGVPPSASVEVAQLQDAADAARREADSFMDRSGGQPGTESRMNALEAQAQATARAAEDAVRRAERA